VYVCVCAYARGRACL